MNFPAAQRLIPFGLVCFALLGCVRMVEAKPAPPQTVRLGRSFNLRVGRQVTLKRERLRIRFVKVSEDSRCPVNVQCIWAGNAAVRLEVSRNVRDKRTLTLNTAGSDTLPGEVHYSLYRVRLVRLTPYPRSNRKIGPGDYTATLEVSHIPIIDNSPTPRHYVP